jgi:hypothetical protein
MMTPTSVPIWTREETEEQEDLFKDVYYTISAGVY